MINTEAASSLGNRTPNVLGTCTIHCRFYCLCFELLMPEPSPLKRLGFFMSRKKKKVNIFLLPGINKAIRDLEKIGVHLSKGAKEREIVSSLIHHSIIKAPDIMSDQVVRNIIIEIGKGVNYSLVVYKKERLSTKTRPIKSTLPCPTNPGSSIRFKKSNSDTENVSSETPSPVGYISRCRQNEPLDLTPDVFYKSWRWKELRLIALDVCGRRCVCCGATPAPSNKVVLHVDHIKPLRSNPSLALDLSNLQVLCEDCNQGKSWFNTNDYRTDSQKSSMSRKQTESFTVTEDAISRMHESFS